MKKKFVSSVLTLILIAMLLVATAVPVHAEPSISAESAILMDADSGRVLYQKNAFVRMPMASTTKIMTAIVAIELCDIKETVTVSEQAVGVEGSSVYLYPEEKLTLEELIYALLLESANDAAAAIAIHVAGSVDSFSALMNQKAEALGLTGTHFVNPHGLDHEDHHTTAYDLAKLTAYALKNEAFRRICGTVRKTIPLKGDEGTRVLINHNKMLSRYDGAIGVKTGFTKKSGRCLVSAAERDGLTLIAVTLSAPDDWNDHGAMLNFGFDNYQSRPLAEKDECIRALSVTGGTEESVKVSVMQPISAILKRGHGEITCRVEAPQILLAPIAKGQTVGRIIWLCDGREIASAPIVAMNDVAYKKAEKQGIIAWFLSLFSRE